MSKSLKVTVNEEDSAALSKQPNKNLARNTCHLWCSSKIRSNNRICLLAFQFFNVAYYNYNCHSKTASVVYKLLLVYIVVFKLSILNKHGCIINYSNKLPAMFSLVLIYFVFLLQKLLPVHVTIKENLTAINTSLNFAKTANFPLITVNKSFCFLSLFL